MAIEFRRIAKVLFFLAILFLPCMRFTIYRNFQWTDLFGILSMGCWGLSLLGGGRLPLVRKRPTLCLSFFLVSVAVSLFLSGPTQEGFLSFLQLLYCFFLFVLAQDLLRSEKDKELVCVAWGFGIAGTLLFGVFAITVGQEDRFGYWVRDFGFQGLFQSRSFCGAYLAVSLVGALCALEANSVKRIFRPFPRLFLFSIFLALLFTSSFSAYLSSGAGLIVFLRLPELFFIFLGLLLLFVSHILSLGLLLMLMGGVVLFIAPKRKWLLPLAGAMACLFLWMPPELRLRFQQLEDFHLSRSFELRSRLNAAALYSAFHHPLGIGLEALSDPETKGTLPFITPELLGTTVHNTYLKLLSESGWASLSFFLLFLTTLFGRGPWRAVFVTLLVGFFFEPGLTWRFAWALFGIGLSRAFQVKVREREVCLD